MNFTFGYTIFNKAHLIPKIVFGIKNVLGEEDEAVFLFDACTDDSLETFKKVRRFLRCKVTIVVSPLELFETKANNRILKIASKDIIVLFQDDMILEDPEMKEKILRVVEKYGDSLGLLGARSGYEWDGKPDYPPKIYKKVSNWEHLRKQYGRPMREGEFFHKTILNRGPIVFTRSLLDEVGYLDETFAPQWLDEVDYCCRSQFEFGRKNGVFQCKILSPLKWGATRTISKLKKTMDKIQMKHWEIIMERWRKDLRKYYRENIA